MLGRMLIGGVIAIAAVVGSADLSHAQLSVDLGFHFGSSPQFEQVPASPVQYAPAVGANLFSYGGQYFVFLGTNWYVGPGHNGPWAELLPQYVPQPILAVPVRYYHSRPREWSYWRHDAPPRWGPTWGNRWEDRYGDRHHHGYLDDHRGVRSTVYRDEHRDDRRGDRFAAYRDEHRDNRRGERTVAYRDDHRDNRRGERPVASRDDRRGGSRDDHRDDRRGGDRRDSHRDDRR
jgi:hypothetical protein